MVGKLGAKVTLMSLIIFVLEANDHERVCLCNEKRI